MIIYLIDGVRVPKRTYERRQLFGEHSGARFFSYEPVIERPRKPTR